MCLCKYDAVQNSVIIRNRLGGELGAKKENEWKGRELFTDSFLNLLARIKN